MRVFLFCHKASTDDLPHIGSLLSCLREYKAEVFINGPILEQASQSLPYREIRTWNSYSDVITCKPDYFITLGGDGTLLNALTYVRDSRTPVLGINLGRLGFLASTEKKLITDAIHYLERGMYEIEERSLIRLDSNHGLFGETPFALNDFTILKRDNSSMITIHTYINGDFLNAYYADGLIVATPTGSTGYSLSCGGPILFPQAENFIITPVAPHNLNVRPVVIPDNAILSFGVEGRAENFLCTLDSRYEVITAEHQLAVKRCEFSIRLVKLQTGSFLKTLQDKLNWGLDKRN